jgi:predicted membrane protein
MLVLLLLLLLFRDVVLMKLIGAVDCLLPADVLVVSLDESIINDFVGLDCSRVSVSFD